MKYFNRKVRNIRKLCLFSILLILTSRISEAENIRLQIDGISGALERNVRAELSTIPSHKVILDHQFLTRVKNAIHDGLKALGYYESRINFNLSQHLEDGNQILIAHILPGEPVRIGGTKVILRGGARTDKDYLDLLKTCPKVDSVLDHSDYDAFKKALTSVAQRKGYFDKHFNKSQLGIALNRHQAFWDIDYDSGERYRFGSVTFEGSQIRDKYLQNLIPFKEGDYYHSSRLIELNRRLLGSGWFSSVLVAPEFDKRGKTISLRGRVSPRSKNAIEIGVGYFTSFGPRIQAKWKKQWTNSYGHSLTTSTSISEPEQQLNFSYKMPMLKNPIEHYYLIQGGFNRGSLNDTESDSTTLILSRYWDFSSGWQRAINLHWSYDRFIQANITHTITSFYPGATISRIRSRGGLMPTWGDSQRYCINHSNTAWGSNVNFSVIQAQNIWIRTLWERHRFITRGNFGWIETSNFRKVPPDLRFFTGGDCSIRGYKYKSISPKDKDGNLIGASKLAIGSLEYEYNVKGKWWGAIFIDGGEAVNNIRQSDFKTGIGVGVRWQSAIGPIKFDFAIPIHERKEHSVQFYIGIGPEL